ncbi:MAG: EAL domain-containing protein, partial [Nitrosospira sp.]
KGALRSLDFDKHSISTQLTRIRQSFKSQGIWAHLNDQDCYSGDIPDDVSLSALKNWLETYDRSHVTARNHIPSGLAKYPALVRFASGIMYIPLNSQDFLLLMRHEQVETVNWAGKSQSSSGEPDALLELTPRTSFQKWSQQVKGVSEPWYDVDIEAAGLLREFLIEHIEKIHLETLALHDPLTNLANRLLFERKLQESIKLSIRNDSLSAVYMLDLDKFKPVNDTMGHAAGDELLIRVAERLKGIVRERDVVARLGGDEFAIIQFHLTDLQSAQITAERILWEIRRPFSIQGQNIEIGVSIGVAICPFHSVEEQELIHGADLALYQAKRAGRNGFQVFSNNMLSAEEQNESVRIRLTHALEHKEFSFVYQPIVNARTRTLQSFEAFARWAHPEKGILLAAEFLPAIEQYQLSLRFAKLGIRQAICQVKEWQRQGLPLVPISLNMSPRQFLALDIVGCCSSTAMEFDVSLEWLRFDLDEAALQTDLQQTAEKIASLAQIGVLTNIDHFGQGMIALKHLLDVKINQLKIPGKLFASSGSARNNALAAIINSIGRGIQVPVVATQIETAEMETHAMNAGIELLQGNYISYGLGPDEVNQWLRSRTGAKP